MCLTPADFFALTTTRQISTLFISHLDYCNYLFILFPASNTALALNPFTTHSR